NYNVDPNTTAADVFSGITTEGVIEDDRFWEAGNFYYTQNVHPQSAKVNTGVKWEGYFIPTITGTVDFHTQSTGYFTVDFNKVGYAEDNNKNQTSASISAVGAGNTYTEHVRIGLSTAISGISSTGSNQITVSGAANLEKMNTIGIGMTVVHSNIVAGTVISKEGGFNKTSGVITLEPPAGTASAVTAPISNQSVTFKRDLGTSVSHSFRTQVLLAYQKYRIRYRYFNHKNFDSKDIERNIDMNYNQNNQQASTNLRYNTLYPLDYDFSDSAKGAFNIYFDNSVRFGGTNVFSSPIGLGSRSDSSKYVKLKSTTKLDITYKVKQVLGSDTASKTTGITRRQTTCSTVSGSSVIPISLTTDIEVGNYVFGTNIQPGTRVEQITINSFLVLNKPTGGSGSQTENLKFIDHRGFVKKITGNGSGKQIVGITTALTASSQSFATIDTDVQPDMVVIGSNTDQYTKITSVDEGSNTLNLSKNVKNTGAMDVYIYQSRGLKDNSIQQFCDRFNTTADGPDVRCLVSNHATTDGDGNATTYTSVGVSTVKVDITPSLQVVSTGWELQGAYFGEDGIAVASVNTSNGVITLASNITKPLPDGAQFTAVSSDIDQN
ncbi:MAG: hypothetical protein VXY93_09855, partial [Pseudomonadota bacterium]|nr:hypothetical protein [Pseudomonadota bacterium]